MYKQKYKKKQRDIINKAIFEFLHYKSNFYSENNIININNSDNNMDIKTTKIKRLRSKKYIRLTKNYTYNNNNRIKKGDVILYVNKGKSTNKADDMYIGDNYSVVLSNGKKNVIDGKVFYDLYDLPSHTKGCTSLPSGKHNYAGYLETDMTAYLVKDEEEIKQVKRMWLAENI